MSGAPIDVAPSGAFDGIDGPWSSHTLRVGTPAQEVNVLISTLTSETWVVRPDGCTSKSPFSNCEVLRGGTFDNDTSNSWETIGGGGVYSFNVEGNQLGDKVNNEGGSYGYDTIALTAVGGGGVIREDQVVAGITTNDFFMGNLGVAQRTPGIQGQTKPSFLKGLYNDKKIPSLSYSYTAGASYRDEFASLTLGGQDTSRFEPNAVNFTLGSDPLRELTVGVQSITIGDGDDSTSLLTDGIVSIIDSTLPNIWIPTADCDKWVDAFGLEFNALTNMYNVNSTQREKNLDTNATITFELGTSVEGGDTVKINFPYSAFDLNYTNPGVSDPNPVYYFPLRQADTNNQFVLGRAFLQNAYLSVNYDWSNFSVSQAVAGSNGKSKIVVLPPFSIEAANDQPPTPSGTGSPTASGTDAPTPVPKSGGGGFPKGAIAGVVIAVLAIALGSFAFFCLRRRRRARRETQPEPMSTPNMPELKGSHHQSGTHYAPVPSNKEGPQMGQPDYFSHTPAPAKAAVTASATELPSPPPQFSSNLGTPDHAGQSTLPSHTIPHELPGDEASHELHSRTASIGAMGATMSQGPSPSLNPTAPVAVARAGASPEPWAAGPSNADFGAALPSPRPSLLSASSVNIINASGARMVSHTRGGSSPQGSQLGGMSPSALGPDVSPGVEHDHSHANVPPMPGQGSGHLDGEDGLRRGGSHRSQASEGTLVNPTDGGLSPEVRAVSPDMRAVSPDIGRDGVGGREGRIREEEDEGHEGLSAFTSPVLGGVGFEGTRERNERLERERMVSPQPLDTP